MREERKYRRFDIDGTGARKLQSVPEYDRQWEEERREQRRRQREQQRRKARRLERTKGLDLGAMVFLTIALLITLYTCVNYVHFRTEITATDKAIVSLKQQILTLTDENDAIRDSKIGDLDLQKVYKIATEQFGMVPQSKGQIIKYATSKEDYFRQYGDIPKNYTEDIFSSMISK